MQPSVHPVADLVGFVTGAPARAGTAAPTAARLEVAPPPGLSVLTKRRERVSFASWQAGCRLRQFAVTPPSLFSAKPAADLHGSPARQIFSLPVWHEAPCAERFVPCEGTDAADHSLADGFPAPDRREGSPPDMDRIATILPKFLFGADYSPLPKISWITIRSMRSTGARDDAQLS